MAVERFPVEEGHVAAFARALGDENPRWFGPAFTAPPTFVIASAQWDPDFALRPRAAEPWLGSGRGDTGLKAGQPSPSGTQLHAEQHFEYRRPLRASDVLSATVHAGRTWEKEGRRSGRLSFAERVIEYRDQNGDLVVVARSVGVRMGEPVED